MDDLNINLHIIKGNVNIPLERKKALILKLEFFLIIFE